MPSNLKRHEFIGLLMMFAAGTLLGLGLYLTMWGANRPLYYGSLDQLMQGKEFLLFPLFYGFSFILFALAQIELKEALPGRRK